LRYRLPAGFELDPAGRRPNNDSCGRERIPAHDPGV